MLPNKQQLFNYLFLMQNKMNSKSVRGSYWYPSMSESTALHLQLNVQKSCLLWGHFLKLSVFLFWVQKSLDRLTMWPLWQAAPHASKRWLTSWQGCGDNTALYRENSAATHSAGCWLGDHSRASTGSSWQHEIKISAHKGTMKVTWRPHWYKCKRFRSGSFGAC